MSFIPLRGFGLGGTAAEAVVVIDHFQTWSEANGQIIVESRQ